MKTRKTFWRNLTRIHKWAGFVLGIQIILWFASGFFMSFSNIDKVHGDFVALKQTFPVSAEQLIPVEEAARMYGDDPLKTATLRSVIDAPVWVLNGDAGIQYIDARTGKDWAGINADQVRSVAAIYYIGKGQVETLAKLDVAPLDYRGAVPVWQVKYDDKERTRLYISPMSGDLLKTRTRLWRIFDFMWMLHIMDYDDRDDINNWWLVLLSFFALLFALSGAALVVHRVFLRPKRKT
ncbi:MAG: hypothetical protein HKO02_14010 [Hyphomonadaceae bacterium]|nr:hypothetical protein [Hyphomonadaceae bacterium]